MHGRLLVGLSMCNVAEYMKHIANTHESFTLGATGCNALYKNYRRPVAAVFYAAYIVWKLV